MSGDSTPLTLNDSLTALRGVGERTASVLARLGLRTAGDLLGHLPIRYETEAPEADVAEATVRTEAESTPVTRSIRGEILKVRMIPGHRPRFEALLEDATGTVRLVWFNSPWVAQKIHPGLRGIAQGRAANRRGYLEMVNPRWQPLDDGPEPAKEPGRLRPIYSASAEIASARIEVLAAELLPRASGAIVDLVPAPLLARRNLAPLAEAYRMVHRPNDLAEAERGRLRLAYDELLLLQLAMAMRRWQVRHTMHAPMLPISKEIDERARSRIHFTLTPAQSGVCAEIAEDLRKSTPMNRLLQGDVGSGKTAVAVYAMLAAVAHGHQAVLVAPTEILAKQHVATIEAMLAGSRVRIAEFTGSLKAADRAAVLAGLEAGTVDLAIGTHALLLEDVKFKSLAVAVVDEQHRFGVEQRAALRAKGLGAGMVPHTLVMTATPIPRTLALSFFGDLDVSSLRGLLPGRSAPATRVMPRARSEEVYAWVRTKIAKGEQAFIVVPAIDESERGLADVASHAAALETGALSGMRIGRLHGQLSTAERAEAMAQFRDGRLDALVATIMVEVGVDVPNATMMIVEHAEQFGLAQLHQLRGRVGRGGKPGACVYIADAPTEIASKRLDALARTSDGFEIAELDLSLRGPGEFFGSRQSGLPPLKVADLSRDFPLLLEAREDATQWIGATGDLADPADAPLRRRVLATYGDALGLSDIG